MNNLSKFGVNYLTFGGLVCIGGLFLFGSAKAFTDTKIGEVTTQNSVILGGNEECVLNYGSPISCSALPPTGLVYNMGQNSCSLTCNHRNVYDYDFKYEVSQEGRWKPLSSSNVNKCDQIKLKFNPKSEWSGSLTQKCTTQETAIPCSLTDKLGVWGCLDDGYVAPASLFSCEDQNSCLAQSIEYALGSNSFGKGVQKVPVGFVEETEHSLSSSDPDLKCADGNCVSYTSGEFSLNAMASATSYFGQCRGYGAVMNTPEAVVPAVTSNTRVTIVNHAPTPTVSFEKNPININEETNVTCDVVDPDECSDKIAKIKWTCTDSNGQSDDCYFLKQGAENWRQGSTTQNIDFSEQSNPYRAVAEFRAAQAGSYAVTCEAIDNDANNPLGGTGIAGVQVVGKCGGDGICNPDCNPVDPDCSHCGSDSVCVQGCDPVDSDCGVVAVHSSYCALLAEEGGSSIDICDNAGEAKYTAYFSGIDPAAYKWKCSADQSTQDSTKSNVTCSYNSSGSYLPSLAIVDKNGKETQCVTQTSTTVIKDSKCSVHVRKAGSEDDYKNNIVLGIADQLEAVVNKQCLKEGNIKWDISNARIVSQNGNSAKLEFNSAGSSQVKAQIIAPDGKATDCGEADVDIKEKVQLRI